MAEPGGEGVLPLEAPLRRCAAREGTHGRGGWRGGDSRGRPGAAQDRSYGEGHPIGVVAGKAHGASWDGIPQHWLTSNRHLRDSEGHLCPSLCEIDGQRSPRGAEEVVEEVAEEVLRGAAPIRHQTLQHGASGSLPASRGLLVGVCSKVEGGTSGGIHAVKKLRSNWEFRPTTGMRSPPPWAHAPTHRRLGDRMGQEGWASVLRLRTHCVRSVGGQKKTDPGCPRWGEGPGPSLRGGGARRPRRRRRRW